MAVKRPDKCFPFYMRYCKYCGTHFKGHYRHSEVCGSCKKVTVRLQHPTTGWTITQKERNILHRIHAYNKFREYYKKHPDRIAIYKKRWLAKLRKKTF